MFDLKEDKDVYWCTADIGWVTGHSYIVYGPLACGATGMLLRRHAGLPRPRPVLGDVERYKATILYTAPTAIRTFMKWGLEYVKKHDLSSLRLLGSVGEPINPEAWMWYYENIGGGRCPVVDTWWQTETGAILITPLPGITTLKPGSATKPFPGIEADIVDEEGKSVPLGGGGYIVLAAAVAVDAARHLRSTPNATRKRTGRSSITSISPATAATATKTATTGSWAASTT